MILASDALGKGMWTAFRKLIRSVVLTGIRTFVSIVIPLENYCSNMPHSHLSDPGSKPDFTRPKSINRTVKIFVNSL